MLLTPKVRIFLESRLNAHNIQCLHLSFGTTAIPLCQDSRSLALHLRGPALSKGPEHEDFCLLHSSALYSALLHKFHPPCHSQILCSSLCLSDPSALSLGSPSLELWLKHFTPGIELGQGWLWSHMSLFSMLPGAHCLKTCVSHILPSCKIVYGRNHCSMDKTRGSPDIFWYLVLGQLSGIQVITWVKSHHWCKDCFLSWH